MTIFIRIANTSDAEILNILNTEFNGEDTSDEEHIITTLLNNDEIVMVAIYNNQIVGFICGKISSSICFKKSHGEISELFVSKKYRKLGIGRKLLEAMETYFFKRNLSVLTLYTSIGNLTAQQFYEKCGYNKKQRIEYRKTSA